ncbi:MAG: EutN/CcmL family microcompartment protein, partial [Polyangia bacterium]
GLDGRRLVLVAVSGEDRVMVAIDTLDAREGQAVLVSVGSGARNVLSPGPDNRALLCDAAIALLVDGET